MKKIMVMFMMLATFALSALAFSESPPGFGSYSTEVEKVNAGQNGLGLVGAAHADDITFVKIDILPLDTLMYSWGEGIDSKLMKLSGYKQNKNATRLTQSAGVTYTKSM